MVSTDFKGIVSNLPPLDEYRKEVRDRQKLNTLPACSLGLVSPGLCSSLSKRGCYP